jgi:hypothetical protein
MRDSQTSVGQKGNKLVIALLAAGTVVMAVAGFLIYQQKSATKTPTEPPPKVEEPVQAKQLVVSQPTRPPLEQRDSEIKEDTGADSAATKNGSGGSKRARLSSPMGKLNTKEVNDFINARFGQVKACYERRLKTNSFLEGKVDLNINISTSGKVTAVTVNKDTVRDAEMLSCVKRAIRQWHFPKPTGGRVIIAKTFNFKKKE